jgi:neurotransmitter:Na+ symporter, NSS family
MALNQRDGFSSKLGVIAAATGSAIGLGNIWRFPYVAGENGGGAFLLLYLVFIIIIGIPVMMSEFVIGRRAQSNAFGSFRKLAPGTPWWFIGMLGIIAAFVILSFYSTVAGWTLEYVVQAFAGAFEGKSHQQLNQGFAEFTSGSFRPLFWQLIFMILTAGVVIAGVKKGIEKYTKMLMPVFIIMIILMCIRSVTLPGASEGLKFLFNPDFSKIFMYDSVEMSQSTLGLFGKIQLFFESINYSIILLALGQAAFSLSIGMGALITYGSYISKDTALFGTTVSVAATDTIIAVLSGVMIFPALMALGGSPDGGAGLVFVTLPAIFQQMPGGYLFAIAFFLLLAVAALTSTISVLEVVVAYLKEELKMSRIKATLLGAGTINLIGVLCTLSFGPLKEFTIFGKTVFDLMDYLAANVFLTFGALFIVIFTGWKLGKTNFVNEINQGGKVHPAIASFLVFIIKYIAPIAIGAVAIGAFFIKGLT